MCIKNRVREWRVLCKIGCCNCISNDVKAICNVSNHGRIPEFGMKEESEKTTEVKRRRQWSTGKRRRHWWCVVSDGGGGENTIAT